ncbi:hypothetical protein BE20_24720 [Sorangium cellulosum]|nr:hypothetical protein BE20_24720 [Sorangium cellulosum]
MPADVAARMEFVTGAADAARVHTDAAAAALARDVAANAVTVGRDIYFGEGQYQPDTAEGRARLAHELVHVDQYLRGELAGRPEGVVSPVDPLEREASAAEGGGAPPQQPALPTTAVPAPADPAVALRQPCVVDPVSLLLYANAWDPETEVDLQGLIYLPDMPEFCAYLVMFGPSLLKVRFGTFARGHIALHYGYYGDHHGLYTDWISEITMNHPALPDVTNQRMAIAVEDDEIFGVVGRVPVDSVAMDTQIALLDWRRDYGDKLLEIPDYRDVVRPRVMVNGIDGTGNLVYSATDYDYRLPGPADSRHAGKASMSLDNERGTVLASATLRAPSLGDGSLTLRRLPTGSFTGTATMSVGPFGGRGGHAGFSGDLRVTYGRRVLDIQGTVRYDGERVSGTGTLRLTDAPTAWASVRPHIVAAVGVMPSSAGPTTGMALTGWGTMTYRFGPWLTGRAAVVVAPDGHIYSRGEIRPTANIRFLDPPRRWRRRIAGPFEAAMDVFDLLAVHFEAGGSVELWAASEFGPGQIHRLRLVGAFSTNTAVPWQLEIGGTINLAAMAELELIAKVFIKGKLLRVVTPVDITATIRGTARLSADAEATATIGRRLSGSNPEGAEYFLDGTFAAYARLAAGLSGRIDFNLLGAGWTPWESAGRAWPIGDVGLERHFSYTFGTPERGNVSVEAPGVEGGTDGLISALARRSAPRNAGRREVDVDAQWRNASAAAVQPFEPAPRSPTAPAAVPDLPDLQPRWVDPSIPSPGSGGTGAGGAPNDDEVGQRGRDAGVDPIAGVPPPPPPYEFFPEAPPRTSDEFDDETIVVPFTMKGVAHRLRLIPAQPLPRLVMESAPDDLEDKIDGEIAEQTREGDTDEVAALEGLEESAEQVIESADALGFGDVPNVTVPELEPLAEALSTHGDQFDQTDLADNLPEAAHEDFDPDVPDPDNTLELPWDDFVARVEALPPVDALILLDAQHDYLQGEISDVSRWLNSHIRGDPGFSAAERRRSDLLDRLRWVLQRRRALRSALNPTSRVALPCFPAGTLVHTCAGVRPIESLRIGDDVWCADPETGAVVAGQVEGLMVNRAVDLYELHTGDDVVSATGAHPFWDVRAHAWVAASALRPGAAVRTLAGGAATITAIERREVPALTTFNLALGPYPTFFVGAGLLVHNGSYALWHTYPWASQHNFKIYVGLNDADEFHQYVYVGQTKQTIARREKQHHDEANEQLKTSSLTAADRFFFRFKQGMRLTAITIGLKGESPRESDQARYLEQKNIDEERVSRGASFVLNRIEACTDMAGTAARIRADPDVTAAGYCV